MLPCAAASNYENAELIDQSIDMALSSLVVLELGVAENSQQGTRGKGRENLRRWCIIIIVTAS